MIWLALAAILAALVFSFVLSELLVAWRTRANHERGKHHKRK